MNSTSTTQNHRIPHAHGSVSREGKSTQSIAERDRDPTEEENRKS
jgi:hypothetical protein